MEKRGQHEDMKKDFAKLMKSCGVSLTRIPKTCLCMKCAERFWNEKKFVNGALWNVYKAKKEREKGINSRRLQIIEKIYKEKVYKEKKCEQLLRQRFPCFIRKINFESKKLLPSEIINIDDLYSEFDMNHIAENNKVSQKGTKCCIARNIAIGTSSDNFPDICGRNDSVRSEMSEQREEYTRPPSYRKSERLTTPGNSPFKNEYTKILLKDFKHIKKMDKS
ncbi:uncharacterized protein LOC113465514 [Diaphorina citri]|uniref:Uncharacterized protein LOC113465514 n=1 Tax=Diaphorina citri TaxID=121845 RepID=A0A3Q0IIB5_DIACI|nr:uncharacterized protein LOC113465514 [Diaphorina citri]